MTCRVRVLAVSDVSVSPSLYIPLVVLNLEAHCVASRPLRNSHKGQIAVLRLVDYGYSVHQDVDVNVLRIIPAADIDLERSVGGGVDGVQVDVVLRVSIIPGIFVQIKISVIVLHIRVKCSHHLESTSF